MKRLFLICPLALPHDPLAQYRQIVAFIHSHMPGYQIVLGEKGNTPFVFNGDHVYLKRSA